MKNKLAREQREREKAARQQHLQYMHEHIETYWQHVDLAVERKSSTGYDEATRLLVELREVAAHFNETQEFQARLQSWVQPHLRRPALMGRLRERNFTWE